MAYELIGIAGMTLELKQFYSRQLLDRTIPNLVWLREGFGNKDGIPANNGRSIEWRRFERPGAQTSALTEGTPGSSTNLTVSNVQATVSQYGRYTIFSEVLNLQAYDPYISETSKMYGEDMAISLDTIVRDVTVAGTTLQLASTAGSIGGVGSGMRLTYAELREASATLKNNDAPTVVDDKYILVIHPHTEHDVMGDSDVIQSLQTGGPRGPSNAMFQGAVGDFYGFRFIVTSNASVSTSLGLSGADVYLTLAFGRGYYGIVDYETMNAQIIVKPVGSSGILDPLNQAGSIGWKAAIVAARLDENRAVRIEHTSSLGSE